MYERLEFLGDAVLGFIVTDYIYRRFPDFQEGELAKLRASVISGDVLAEMAAGMDLGRCIFMGKGVEQMGGRHRGSILADCFEAIMGAAYLDAGIADTREIVLRIFEERIVKQSETRQWTDYKSRLQEHTMREMNLTPGYEILAESGPSHEKSFRSVVVVGGERYGEGVGTSKKRAEQAAAHEALRRLGVEE
jgi:ribonuclease-3